jgi:hypothetical protein
MSAFGSLLITRLPLVFFVTAAMTFSGAFLAFAFLTFGSKALRALTVMCASLLIGYIAIVLLWILKEMLEVEDISRWIPFRAAVRPRPAPAPSHFSVPTHRNLESRSPGRGDAVGVLRSGMPEVVAFESVQDGSVNRQPPFVPANQAGAVGPASLAEVGGTLHRSVPVRQLRPIATLHSLPNLGASHSNGSPLARESIRLSGIKQALQHPDLTRCAFKLQPFASAIRRIAFSADGHFLVSCAWDPSVKVWKVDLHKPRNPILYCHCPETSVVNDVVWCPDPKQTRFLALCDKLVTLWQVEV